MIKIYILVIFSALVNAGVIEKSPNCITIRGNKYEEEELHNGVHNPYQLAIDYDTNTLFFSYTARTSDIFEIAYLNLKTNDYGLVGGIPGGFANAVNSKSQEVYMGGQDGIYKFDYNTKNATKINGATDANIWQMFYKNGLFFTTYPDEMAFMYDHNQVKQIPELKGRVSFIAVKNNGNYIYANSSGLFSYDKSSKTTKNMGDYVLNGIISDINGNIYFSTPTRIYAIDDKTNELEQLFTAKDIFGIAVENNGNIIYAKADSIVRLKPTTKACTDKSDTAAELTVAI